MLKTIITNSPKETKNLAVGTINSLDNRRVLCLYGDLGSGKTTFCQGLGELLGITRMVSPTFILMRDYPIKNKKVLNNPSLDRLHHIDLYRLESLKEITSIGIEEIISDEKNLVLIEWPEKIEEILPPDAIKVKFRYLKDQQREITFL